MSDDLWTAAGVERLELPSCGPLARTADGAIVSVADDTACVSRDAGRTWSFHPLFARAPARLSAEGALVATRAGTLVLSFLDLSRQSEFGWDAAAHDTPADIHLPHCTLRSLDGGATWQDLVTLHQEWTGDARDLTQLRDGRLVLTSQRLLHHPGRHAVLTYASDDDGLTWQASNVIDLGGVGHHGGVTEATVAELGDGRLWLLLRTNWGRFWQAFSEDRGSSWRTIGPSAIEASSAPGLLRRLASGRLLLVWNRPHPADGSQPQMLGGDGQFSEVRASNHRRELSAALSEDDGRTWAPPAVVARSLSTAQDGGWLAYPHLLEAAPGVLWMTTMQGDLRLRLCEELLLRAPHRTAPAPRAAARDRVVLPGVPRVQVLDYTSGHCPEDVCEPAVMRALMEHCDEAMGCACSEPTGRKWGLGCAFGYFVGVMGGAASIAWVAGWRPGSFTLDHLPAEPDEPFRRAFGAVGYPACFLHRQDGEARFRAEVVASLRDRSRAAILRAAIVGPPEPALITGYDEGGDVLLGWSHFQRFPEYAAQVQTEESGYFRKRAWFAAADALITVGQAGPMPDQRQVALEALRWNLAIARCTEVRGAATGPAAYDDWVAHLLDDGDFEGRDEAALRQRHDAHYALAYRVATVRWYGSIWLVNTYRRLPHGLCEPLLKAAGCWAAEHDLMYRVWDLAGGIHEPDWRLFCRPEVRRQIAALIGQSREEYVEAAAHIEAALGRVPRQS